MYTYTTCPQFTANNENDFFPFLPSVKLFIHHPMSCLLNFPIGNALSGKRKRTLANCFVIIFQLLNT